MSQIKVFTVEGGDLLEEFSLVPDDEALAANETADALRSYACDYLNNPDKKGHEAVVAYCYNAYGGCVAVAEYNPYDDMNGIRLTDEKGEERTIRVTL